MRNVLMVLFLAVMIAGCSGGGGTPTTPSPNERPAKPHSLNDIPIIEATSYSDGTFQALGLMGAYELQINPETMTADLVSKRTPSALGNSWTVSGIGFFTVAPCSDCLKLASISLTTENYLQLHFSISHPFPKGNPANPPSAVNRLDLDIFDLAMVIAPIGATATTYAQTGASAYSGMLANNPGYTTELKNVTGDGAAMPYVLVIDDSISGTGTWNKFAMGTVSSFFDVFFDLDFVTTLTFDMYLTMGYGQSAQGKSQRLMPTYFNPEFNRKQAWKVVVIPPEGSDPPTMDNTWNDVDPVTAFNVTVKVFDWQQGVTTIANPPVNKGDIAKASKVSLVSVEIPGMTAALATATTAVSGTGTPADPLVFEIPMVNENLLDDGEYIGIVKVSDERIPETTPTTIDFMIDSPDGFTLTNYAIPEFAAYQIFKATVVIGNTPPTCAFDLGTTSINVGESVLCTPGAMTDNSEIISYEWDLDYNGTTFTADITQMHTEPTFGNPFMIGPFCLSSWVDDTHTIALRVKDDGIIPFTTICTQDLDIIATWSPTSVDLVADTVNRGEGGSVDPELITSVSLTWTAMNPCVQQYVIQKADNFLNPTSWSSAGTATTNSYSYSVGTANLEKAHRVRMYARMFTGSDTVVSPYSEEVAMAFPTAFFASGSPRILERTREYVGVAGNPSLASGGLTTFTSTYNADNYPTDHMYSYACFTNPSGEWNFTNRWGMHCNEFPDLVGQTTAYIDCYVRTSDDPDPYRPWVDGGGFCFGTCSSFPTRDAWVPTVFDFLPTNDARGSLYAYETPNIEGFLTEYGDTNQSGFQNISDGSKFEQTSYYVYDLLNADRDWFAVAYAVGSTSPATVPPGSVDYLCVGIFDAMAIVIY